MSCTKHLPRKWPDGIQGSGCTPTWQNSRGLKTMHGHYQAVHWRLGPVSCKFPSYLPSRWLCRSRRVINSYLCPKEAQTTEACSFEGHSAHIVFGLGTGFAPLDIQQFPRLKVSTAMFSHANSDWRQECYQSSVSKVPVQCMKRNGLWCRDVRWTRRICSLPTVASFQTRQSSCLQMVG